LEVLLSTMQASVEFAKEMIFFKWNKTLLHISSNKLQTAKKSTSWTEDCRLRSKGTANRFVYLFLCAHAHEVQNQPCVHVNPP
jgi:hypothetical protein